MINTDIKLLLVLPILFLTIVLCNCTPDHSPEVKAYIDSIRIQRNETDIYMKENPGSPFNYKGKVEFHPLNYFDVDPKFKFESKLFGYDSQDTVTIYGTKGEARKTLRYGYVTWRYNDRDYKINVYRGISRGGEVYYSIWFTDKTTNNESYGVGRYINFEKSDNPDHIYTIDFNLAYNPYCAYSKEYSCAIPTKEDYLDLAIEAGEKKFHD